MRAPILACLIGFSIAAMAEVKPPEGHFENGECLECHQKSDGELVAAWQKSAHAITETRANCVDCHGNRHHDAAAQARSNESCVNCHGGKKSPEVHSYSTSKHGVLLLLEKNEWDWDQPLAMANYRAPGCAYCHMHKGNHNVSENVRKWSGGQASDTVERERIMMATRIVCQDCHSPRYVSRLLQNGQRMLDIGRMKVKEAIGLLEQAKVEPGESRLTVARRYLGRMQSRHLKNLYLGIGHQSPDYQWWHGQPALDGDLLRIKDALGEPGIK